MRRLIVLLTTLLQACGSSGAASAAGDVDSLPKTDLPAASLAAPPIAGQSDALKAAQTAISGGHPWRATQLVAPALRDPRQRTPATVLIGARAAAAWRGWAEVDKLLAGQPWLDTQFNGEGRELLAQSALERGDDTAAVTHAAAALAAAKESETRGARLVLLARTLERNNQYDSASVLYAQAAEVFGPIRDWLFLRSGGSQSDSAKRATALGAVMLAVAKPRVTWTDAQARERFGDALGAASRYAAVGAAVPALRLRLSVASDSATRNVVKGELLALVRAKPGSFDARSAVDVLDKGFTSLAPAEELIVARSSAMAGVSGRATSGFERALASPSLMAPNDRVLYAQALSRMGRSRDALAQLGLVQGPLAAHAAYQRARVLLTSSTNDATRAALRDVAAKFPADTAAASSALFLLADLATDNGNDAEARSVYRQLYQYYPASVRAGAARFNSAVIAFAAGDARSAGVELDSMIAMYPRAEDALAARYWSGRAWAQAGNPTLAKARWRSVIDAQPMSYYAFASAKRLGETGWSPAPGSDAIPRVPAVDSAIARAELLEQLGMETEARFEYDALDASSSSSPDRGLATAHAFVTHGQASRAIRIAQRLADGGLRDARVYRVLFPIVDRDELAQAALSADLDPALVAGLIRQESAFNPRAVSVANARGLMQVLPNVGQEIARSLKYPVWYPALLLDADANLQLGTAHLAGFVKQYGALPRVLAAYNAGGSRVARWSTKAGMDDPEIFIERIPFVETRDYVRLVSRNAEVYRALDARR